MSTGSQQQSHVKKALLHPVLDIVRIAAENIVTVPWDIFSRKEERSSARQPLLLKFPAADGNFTDNALLLVETSPFCFLRKPEQLLCPALPAAFLHPSE